MHLTAAFKLRANNHDRARVETARRRWSGALKLALERAERRSGDLLRCVIPYEGRHGTRLVVDGKRLHEITKCCVVGYPTGLHSAFAMTMIVELEAMLRSWLGLRLEWMKNRKTPKPTFPSLAALDHRDARRRWERALLEFTSAHVSTALENLQRAEVARAARSKLQPLPFGAASSGVASQAHCGLLLREDGRYFALLTLFPQGDALGEPVRRAANRRDRGAVRNVRAETPFSPTDRARASIMVPLELHRGHETLFFRRAIPKSAEVVERGGEFYLHVAFEFPDHEPRPRSGNLLILQRGIGTLVAWTVMDERGRVLDEGALSGRDLARLISEIGRVRAVKQGEGRVLRGDRRASRITEHHLYSAGHQLIDIACRHQAEMVLLEDRGSRRPTRWLAWKHFHRLHEILGQLCDEAGLAVPAERKLYGSERICLRCGWKPGDPSREDTAENACGACGEQRHETHHVSRLFGLNVLYYRLPATGRPSFAEFLRVRR